MKPPHTTPPPMLAVSLDYGVASISRMLKNIGLFCKRALQKRPIFLKETYIFKHSINRSHPILLTTINEYFLLLFTNILLLTNMALTFSQKNAIALFFFFCWGLAALFKIKDVFLYFLLLLTTYYYLLLLATFYSRLLRTMGWLQLVECLKI